MIFVFSWIQDEVVNNFRVIVTSKQLHEDDVIWLTDGMF